MVKRFPMPNEKVSLEKMLERLDAWANHYARSGWDFQNGQVKDAIRTALIEHKEFQAKYDELKKVVGRWKETAKATASMPYPKNRAICREGLLEEIAASDFVEGKKKS